MGHDLVIIEAGGWVYGVSYFCLYFCVCLILLVIKLSKRKKSIYLLEITNKLQNLQEKGSR